MDKFDPAIAFAPIVSHEPTQTENVKHYDPWTADDGFMGKPRPRDTSLDNNIDWRDQEFRAFAREEGKTPRKVTKLTYRDPLMAAFDSEMILGKSDE